MLSYNIHKTISKETYEERESAELLLSMTAEAVHPNWTMIERLTGVLALEDLSGNLEYKAKRCDASK